MDILIFIGYVMIYFFIGGITVSLYKWTEDYHNDSNKMSDDAICFAILIWPVALALLFGAAIMWFIKKLFEKFFPKSKGE